MVGRGSHCIAEEDDQNPIPFVKNVNDVVGIRNINNLTCWAAAVY